MKPSTKLRLAVLLGLQVPFAVGYSSQALAQDDAATEGLEIEEIVSLGTRTTSGRSVTESVAPVDVLSSESMMSRSDGDMSNIIRQAVPSFNVNDQPISDAATVVRPANLRGLAPDHTLVMINGKRRHRAAVIAFLGGGLSDGAQGPDLAVIPAAALKRVEVLRDGAAAQYGSDAIAGVMNFVLKDDSEGASLDFKVGSTFEGDGDFYSGSYNRGFELTSSGFANLTVEYGEKGATSRSIQRDDAIGLNASGFNVRDPAQIWGQPETRDDVKVFLNTGIDLSDSSSVYAFGNYAARVVEGGFFFRNPTNRSGVYASGGNPLIGDLTADGSGACTTHAAAISDPDCWSFQELFPNGFTPSFGADTVDLSGVAGYRGETESGISYDISYGAGYNKAAFFISNTINPSMGPDTPTTFNPGTYIQIENNFNIDLTKSYDSVNVAGGFEWRQETFEAQIGDIASWKVGPLTEQGFGIGSNGFQGFGPMVAGSWSRQNIALYGDVEWSASDNLMLGAALRYEDFSSFGSTTNGKLSARYEMSDSLAIRATASTGFRAPTPGQANVVNTTTAAGPTGDLIDQGTIASTTAALINSNAKVLQPEESTNLSIGLVYTSGNLDITADFYSIDVSDRIALTDNYPVSDADRVVLLANGVPGAEGLSAYRFFANDFDTETTGFDLVATLDVFDGAGELGFVFNHNKTKVVGGDLLSDGRIRQLEENLPENRFNVSYTHDVNENLRLLGRANYYGSVWEAHLDAPELPIDIDAAVTFDVEANYQVNDKLSMIAGVANLTDEAPGNPWAGVVGAKHAVTSPYGFQGGSYYIRAHYEFD